jgi:hypothetical protein
MNMQTPTQHPFDLNELTDNCFYDIEFVRYCRMRNVQGMSKRLFNGTSVINAVNTIHYYPEAVRYVIDAICLLDPMRRDSEMHVLRAICHRMRGTQTIEFEKWQAEQTSQIN